MDAADLRAGTEVWTLSPRDYRVIRATVEERVSNQSVILCGWPTLVTVGELYATEDEANDECDRQIESSIKQHGVEMHALRELLRFRRSKRDIEMASTVRGPVIELVEAALPQMEVVT